MERKRHTRQIAMDSPEFTRPIPLEQFPSLLKKLRQPIPPEEIERRRRLSERVDRLRNNMPMIEEPMEEWSRAEQEGDGYR